MDAPYAILRGEAVAAYPLTVSAVVRDLDELKSRDKVRCNICDWRRAAQDDPVAMAEGFTCPNCSCTPFARAALRFLANDHRALRGERCVILSKDTALCDFLGRGMFAVGPTSGRANEFLGALAGDRAGYRNIVLDMDEARSDQERKDLWSAALRAFAPDG